MKVTLTSTPSSHEESSDQQRREAIGGTHDEVVRQVQASRDVGVDQLIGKGTSDGSFGSDVDVLSRFLTQIWPTVFEPYP
jgi:hypothetical protein